MRNKSLTLILFINLLSSLTFSMAHPVTPMLIKELGLPTFMFGVFFATMSIGNFIGSPLFGSLSDSKGRIKFLILGALGYGISQLGFGYSTNALIILLFRFTGGFFVVSYLTTSMAYLTDLTNAENRVKYVTYYSAINTVGSALGSLLGGIIGNNNYRATFLVQFILSLILAALVYFLLAETVTPSNNKLQLTLRHKNKTTKITNRNLSIIFLVIVLFYFSSTSYNSTINYYIEDILNLPPSFIGGFLAVSGIVGFTINLIFTPILAKVFKEISIFKVLTLLISASLILMTLCNNTSLFLCSALLFAALASMHIPLQQAIVTKLSHGNYGAVMGVLNSCKAVGMISGSLLSGFIFDFWSKSPFLISAIVIASGFIILFFTNEEK